MLNTDTMCVYVYQEVNSVGGLQESALSVPPLTFAGQFYQPSVLH